MDAAIILTVNGRDESITSDPQRPLLDVLREDLHLTGAHYGCGEGQCGACTVLVDGKRVFSCITPIGDVDKKRITTIEGLAKGDVLHPVQEAFLQDSAFQCGYCTSGMIMAATALLSENPRPSDDDVRQWMNTNLCRCCGYAKILGAVRKAAAEK